MRRAIPGSEYVRALQKLLPDSRGEADLALLHGANTYLILHNVACIYTVLSQAGDRPSPAHEDVAIALLRRAVQSWLGNRRERPE